MRVQRIYQNIAIMNTIIIMINNEIFQDKKQLNDNIYSKYVYCHPQTDCFVVSQLFSVARHVRRLKLGSKPAQLYVSLSIRPLGQQAYHHQRGNFKVLSSGVSLFTFYTLPDTRVLNSFEELCIMQAAAVNSFDRVLNPHGGANIYLCVSVY